MIVADIEAPRENLLRRGVKVSEVFHGAGDVYAGPEEPYLFGRIRVKGPDPAYGSYRSSAVQRSSTQGLGGGSTPTTTTTMTFASFNSPHLAPPARATAGCFRKSPRDFPAESTAQRRPSHLPMTWRARFGAQRPHTASTRSAPGSATQTGQTGMPPTWWRRQAGRSCRRSDFERSLGRRVVGSIPAESGVGQTDAL
jgi:hypothetical protein